MDQLTIGSHISSSKGYEAMGKTAVYMGADTFAFFTRNPRGGKAKEIKPEDVEKYKKIAKEYQFGKIVAHAPYTMNACAAKEDLREFAKNTMRDDLERMEYIPGNYYNFHPGSHVGQGAAVGIEKIAEILNAVLKPECGKARVRLDGLTYGGFRKEDSPNNAEDFMKALLARYQGEVIDYEEAPEAAEVSLPKKSADANTDHDV